MISVDMPLRRGRTVEGLAQPRHALVSQNLHPQQVGELSDADGLDAGDFHRRTLSAPCVAILAAAPALSWRRTPWPTP